MRTSCAGLFLALLASTIGCDQPLFHSAGTRRPPTDRGCGPNAAPTNPAGVASPEGITITWEGPSTNEDGFLIDRRTWLNQAWVEIGRTAADETAFLDTSAVADLQYGYQVRSFRETDAELCGSVASDEVVLVSWPKPPRHTSAAPAMGPALRVAWEDSNDFELGYRVERSDGGGPFVEVSVVDHNETEYDDETATPATAYSYRVLALNESGEAAGDEATARMHALPQLEWHEDPRVQDDCSVFVPGRATFDAAGGAVFGRATGSMTQTQAGGVSADETGVRGVLTDLTPGSLHVGWTVYDDIDLSAAIEGDVLLETTSVHLTSARRPTRTLGEDGGSGGQAILGGCRTCTGRRGSIALGAAHSCALAPSGRVYCWGAAEDYFVPDDVYGMLGNGIAGTLARPTTVCDGGPTPCATALAGVMSVDKGANHNCAVTTGGTLKCWGADYSDSGQLGTGDVGDEAYPTEVCASGSVGGGDCVPFDDVRSVSVGDNRTCAVRNDDSLWCWGDNGWGYLGIGSSDYDPHPNPVSVLAGVAGVSVASDFTCAAMRDGTAQCWGDDYYWQLGDGAGSDSEHLTPTPVCATGIREDGDCVPLAGVLGVETGDLFACALIDDGAGDYVVCWGNNGYGYLGDGTDYDSPNPFPVCATGSTLTGDCVPLAGVASLAVGQRDSCAVLDTGQARCWGFNYGGTLGDGTGASRINPVALCATGATDDGCVPASGVSAIAVGDGLACGIISGGVQCWGSEAGTIGNGLATHSYFALRNAENPADVCVTGTGSACARFTGVLALDVHDTTACAVSNGSIRCWGSNDDLLGVGGTDHLPPGWVCASGAGPDCVPLEDVVSLQAGLYHTCALTGAGRVWCWGNSATFDDENGALGNGWPDEDGLGSWSAHPVAVCESGVWNGSACEGGQVLSGVVSLAAGGYFTCAVRADGQAACWGDNSYGQLGAGIDGNWSTTPKTVCAVGSGAGCSPLVDVVGIATGLIHACAVLANGEMRCWGDNFASQLGDGTTSRRINPVTVMSTTGSGLGPLANVATAAAGYEHTCALLADGTVKCWGDNTYAQLGDGSATSRPLPVDVCMSGSGTGCPVLDRVAALSSGHSFACAVREDGRVFCWGYSYNGQIGASTYFRQRIPVPICSVEPANACDDDTTCAAHLDHLTAVGLGAYHACALQDDGRVYCWGANDGGQLGMGDSASEVCVPREVCASGGGLDCSEGGVAGSPFTGAAGATCDLVSVRVP